MRKLLIFALILCACSCTRRPLSDIECGEGGSGETADIEVVVNWSFSGFETDEMSKSEEDYIHRVTFRFFPTDGAPPFDRYLEDDIEHGVINVPRGEYSVVIFNESIYDPYWEGAITFTDVDSFDRFAAEIVDQDPQLYDFYDPAEGENLSVEALKLASCSVERFVVSSEMCTLPTEEWSAEDLAMAELLKPVSPRRLTCLTTIEVDVENLASANYVHASLTGLAQRVFLASGDTDSAITTHVGQLTQRTWHSEEKQHGVISESRLTFSIPATSIATSSPQHQLTLEVMLVDGTRHTPAEEMVYDVTDQIRAPLTRYADDDLRASVSLSLPEVSGDVEVEDWGEDNVITIQ